MNSENGQRSIQKRVAVVVALLASLATATAQPGNDAANIRAVLDTQQAAWNRGDIDGFMAGYARDRSTAFVGGATTMRGWINVRDHYREKYDTAEKMGRLTFSELNVKLLNGDIAVVDGRWALRRKHNDVHGYFTLVMRRLAAGWRIVHDHTSTAP